MPHLLHWSVSVHHMSFFLVRAQNFTISNVNHEKRRIETPIERYPTPLFHFLHSSPDGAGGRAILPHPILPPPLFLPQILLPQIISHPSNPPSGPSKSERGPHMTLMWHSQAPFSNSFHKVSFFLINPPNFFSSIHLPPADFWSAVMSSERWRDVATGANMDRSIAQDNPSRTFFHISLFLSFCHNIKNMPRVLRLQQFF